MLRHAKRLRDLTIHTPTRPFLPCTAWLLPNLNGAFVVRSVLTLTPTRPWQPTRVRSKYNLSLKSLNISASSCGVRSRSHDFGTIQTVSPKPGMVALAAAARYVPNIEWRVAICGGVHTISRGCHAALLCCSPSVASLGRQRTVANPITHCPPGWDHEVSMNARILSPITHIGHLASLQAQESKRVGIHAQHFLLVPIWIYHRMFQLWYVDLCSFCSSLEPELNDRKVNNDLFVKTCDLSTA